MAVITFTKQTKAKHYNQWNKTVPAFPQTMSPDDFQASIELLTVLRDSQHKVNESPRKMLRKKSKTSKSQVNLRDPLESERRN